MVNVWLNAEADSLLSARSSLLSVIPVFMSSIMIASSELRGSGSGLFDVVRVRSSASRMSARLVTGVAPALIRLFVPAEKADIGLRVMVQVRNKIIDAYNEIMKMQCGWCRFLRRLL
jgi:hypothetical protein